MTQWKSLLEEQNPARFATDILPWVVEAGGPYFEVLFGGTEEAQLAIGQWAARESSEVSLRRVTLLLESDIVAGGFIGMGGMELARCRKADLIAVMGEGEGEPAARSTLMARMGALRGLFAPIEPDQFYLSKMGVARSRQGAGLGHVIIRAFLDAGRAARYRRFALDVWAGNERATALYVSEGFRVVRESTCGIPGMVYRTMVQDLEAR